MAVDQYSIKRGQCRLDKLHDEITMFELGHIVAPPTALNLLNHHHVPALELLRRHVTGDFGDLCSDDIAANLHAIKTGLRILSKYQIDSQNSVYIITEADRSSTCVLLPKEY